MLSREAPDGGRAARPAARPLTRVAAIALAAVALVGCGEETPDESSGGAVGESAELAITVDADGRAGDPAEARAVSCPGDAAAVCDAVAALPEDPAAPVPPQTACTEIYGGPDVVTIEGTLRGAPVDATLTRVNGCEIDRFDRFGELLGALFPEYEPGQALGA